MPPSFLTLQCPSCGGRSRFAAGSDRFTCDYCGNEHLFQLAAAPAARQAAFDQPIPAPRPSNVTVEKNAGVLKFSWRWFSGKYIFLALFCAVWDGFLCFWYSVALSGGNPPAMMLLFPIFHLAIGAFLTYSVIAGFLNRTTVTIDAQNFAVRHDPAPWPGEITTPVTDLSQLYCRETRRQRKRGESYTYSLRAVLRDGRQINLISGLDSPEIAQFLEQEVETHLRIADRPVVGELQGI
jgi:hypothetical protein